MSYDAYFRKVLERESEAMNESTFQGGEVR
jgi:hypothetical protein